MSIIGIGIDIIYILRFKKLIIKHGMKIPKKILSKNELKKYQFIYNPENFLAKRFAAKEAMAKAMGISIYKNMFLKNCEVIHNLLGKPELKIFGYVKNIAKKLKIKKIFLSITDSKKYAQSIVILED